MGNPLLSRAWNTAMVAGSDCAVILRDSLELSAVLCRVVMVYAAIPTIVISAVRGIIHI